MTTELFPSDDRRTGKVFLSLPLGFLVLGPIFIGSAQAQQVEAGAEPSLQTVTVTARKQAENIQDVPASITAVDADQLLRDNVTDLNDLTRVVPGLNVEASEPNHLNLSIRGITSASDKPTVGFLVDDIPVDTPIHDLTGQYEPPILDVARVEVLAGPQGTLYGGSAMGGAVNYISHQASFDRFEVEARAEIAQTQDGGVGSLEAITANLPLSDDRLALRVSLSHDEIAGYIDRVAGAEGVSPTVPGRPTFTSLNTVNDSDINSYTVNAVKVSLTWAPGAGVEVIPRFMYQQTKTPDASEIWPNLPGYESSYLIAQPVEDTFTLGSVTVNKSFWFGDFTSISGGVWTKDNTTQDFSVFNGGIFPNLAAFSYQPSFEGSSNRSFTQEFRLAHSDKNSPFGYVGGGYYRHLDVERFQDILVPGSGLTSQTLPVDWEYGDHGSVVERETALFGEAYYRVGPFELTLGGRAYDIKQVFEGVADGVLNGGLSPLDHEPTNESGFSPKAVISAKLSENNLVYALASQGFRIGGPTGGIPGSACSSDLAKLGLSTAPTSYNSDSLWNYEVGSKNEFGGAWIVNATAFYINWSKLQQFVSLPCGFGYVGNVGAAVSKGVELQVAYKPLEGLALRAGAVYDNARITQSNPFVPAQVGDPVELAPDWVINASADYSFPLPGTMFGELHTDFQYHGSQTQGFNPTIETDVNPVTGTPLGANETVPNPSNFQEAYRSINASVGVRSKPWSARLVVQNASNSRPLLAFGNNGYGYLPNAAYTLTPRTYRLVVTWRY